MGEGHEPRPIRAALSERIAAPLYLARHGQTAYNLEGRFQGHRPVPLDQTGLAQAAELAERAVAYGFRELWCSPLLRARETADIVAARLLLEPREDARLVETDAGEWTGRSFADVRADAPVEFDAFVAADPDFAFPGGESFLAQEQRVDQALRDIERDAAAPTLVVCHGMVIRAAFAARAADRREPFERVANAALVALPPLAALPS